MGFASIGSSNECSQHDFLPRFVLGQDARNDCSRRSPSFVQTESSPYTSASLDGQSATFRFGILHVLISRFLGVQMLLGTYFAPLDAYQLSVQLHPWFRGKVFCSPEFRPRAEIWLHQTVLLIVIFGKLCSSTSRFVSSNQN